MSIATAIVFAINKRKNRVAKILFVAGIYNFFCGFLFASLSAGHFIFVFSEPFLGRTLNNGGAFEYNFRFYSLLLLGAVNFILAFKLLKTSPEIISGNKNVIRTAINFILVILLVNTPLAPIQGFATAFIIFGIINLTLLLLNNVQSKTA